MPGSLGQVQGNRNLLDWVLLGSGSNSIIKYCNESYLEGGKNKEKLKVQLGRRKWLLMSARKWDLGTLCFAQRSWFCLCLDKIMEWSYFISFITVTECPCLMVVFCEID